MAEGTTQRANSTYDRANRIEELRNRIPLGYLIKFPSAMTQAQLRQIPKVTITKELAKLRIQCTVCFRRLKRNESKVRKLPCNHMYHQKCIFPWLKDNPSCPTCREQLVNREDEDFEDVISEHFDMLTRDLMRHLAESGAEDNSGSDSESESDNEPQNQEQPVSATDDGTDSVQCTIPSRTRRVAALRAASAIKEIYRPRRTVKTPKNIAKRSTKKK